MVRRVVFAVYPRITALDLVGPHEVFGTAGGYDLLVAAPEAGTVVTGRGPGIVADRSFASVGEFKGGIRRRPVSESHSCWEFLPACSGRRAPALFWA